ncbi:MAG: MazG family protein [Propionibacteriaceae bacterium]|nr:MazG family protein [Propionibacteriaceae bacterium]
MHRLRSECPWDAQQTHLSLVNYLVEETLEVVDAIEAGSDAELVEELGDLLLQVVFHAEIGAREGRFTIEDVAAGIANKLVERHPYVFTDADVPDDLLGSWEQRKAAAKGRTSITDGISERMSALSRAAKVLERARSLGHPAHELGVAAAEVPPDEIGAAFLGLVAAAQRAGLDPEQTARATLRRLEERLPPI